MNNNFANRVKQSQNKKYTGYNIRFKTLFRFLVHSVDLNSRKKKSKCINLKRQKPKEHFKRA